VEAMKLFPELPHLTDREILKRVKGLDRDTAIEEIWKMLEEADKNGLS